MKIQDIITENINFYDRFGHDSGPQTLPYTVEVQDRDTGGKKLISIEAVSRDDARERARDRGYRVVRVVSQDESGQKRVREHDGRDDEPEEIDDDGMTMADRARRDGRGSDDEPETAAQRRKRSLQATRDFNRGRRADSMREGVAEGVNAKQIKKDLDAGMSHDAVIGKHANKRMTNTDEIRRVIQQHAWEKRMKRPKEQGVSED